jgi:hypothetical protein
LINLSYKSGCLLNFKKIKKVAAYCICLIFIGSVFTASVSRANSSTVIFSSGFEDGFNSWTATNGGISLAASFSPGFLYGGYSMMCSDPWGSQATKSITPQSEACTSAEFYFGIDFQGRQTLIAYYDGQGNPIASMGLSVQSGNLYAFVQTYLPSYSYSQYLLNGPTQTSLFPGGWVKFQLEVSATSATIYMGDLKLASVLQTSIPPTSSVSVGMFWGDGAYTGKLFVDNVQISTSYTPSMPMSTNTGTSLLYNGFEDAFSNWTSTHGSTSIVSSPVYRGNYAMKCSDTWNSQAIKAIGSQSETYTSAQFYFDKNIAGSQTLIAYFNANGDPSASLGIMVQSGKLYLFVQVFLPTYTYRQYELKEISSGTWNKFALDASTTSVDIYVNSQIFASIDKLSMPATALVGVGMFWGNGIYTGNLYVDNVQISTEPTWSQIYGVGSASCVIETSDGGYLISNSLTKTDASGNVQWNKTYGGSSVVQTSDGGYLVAGSSVGGLVKTDESGNIQWSKNYNGFFEGERCAVQTYDGGYAAKGYENSIDGRSMAYLVKTDGSGNMQWNKTYGLANSYVIGESVVQTSDKGYAIVGYKSGGPTNDNIYVVKTDASGNLLWNETFGETHPSRGYSIVQTLDQGLVIAGYIRVAGINADFYLIKMDSSGNMLWNKTFGRIAGDFASDDSARSLVQTIDGGFAIAGFTSTYRGYYDTVYLVKTDSDGNMQWSRLLRAAILPGDEYGESMIQSSDGGYVIVGTTYSYQSAYGGAYKDAGPSNGFLIKTDADGY